MPSSQFNISNHALNIVNAAVLELRGTTDPPVKPAVGLGGGQGRGWGRIRFTVMLKSVAQMCFSETECVFVFSHITQPHTHFL